MSLVAALLIIVVVATLANGAMLLARRLAPPGGFFADSDRAAGVFGVVGTGFAVLLAFVIFIAFESYNGARDSSAIEAVAVRQLFRTATLFEPDDQARLQGELVCYGRSVVGDEWRTMRRAEASLQVDDWLERFEATIGQVRLDGPREEAAFEHWLSQAAVRQEGRRGRLAEASPFVPPVVWVVLVLAGVVVVAYVGAYADPAERRAVQGLMMTAVATMVTSGLLLVRVLDRPYHGSGRVRPVVMQDALDLMEPGVPARALPCDADGRPT